MGLRQLIETSFGFWRTLERLNDIVWDRSFSQR